MAVTTTNLGVITAYGDAVAAGYTGTKAEWQALMASYATVGQQAVDAKNDAVAAKNTAVSKATEATTAASTATTKANEASASAQSIAQSAAQIQENTDSIDQLMSDFANMKSDGAVPSAEQILTDKGVTDSVPYHYRKTGGGGADRLYDQIVGGTVCWNQLVEYRTFSGNGITAELSGTTALHVFGENTSGSTQWPQFTITKPIIANHAYLVIVHVVGTLPGTQSVFCKNIFGTTDAGITITNGYGGVIVKSTASNSSMYIYKTMGANETIDATMSFIIFDLTQMFGSTVADYIYQLEQTTAGDGVAFFKSLFPNDYYPYNAGELVSVSGLSEHKMVGFNQWDEEWEKAIINSSGQLVPTSGNYIATKNMITVLPNTTYSVTIPGATAYISEYDSLGNFTGRVYGRTNGQTFTTSADCHGIMFYLGYTAPYNHDICINLSDPAKNGTYEPYKAHSYPLDSTLTLRGVPKIVDGKMCFDGDTYDADGTVTRRYGVVDLGTLDWAYSNGYFDAGVSINVPTKTQWEYQTGQCSRYKVERMFYVINAENRIDNCIAWYSTAIRVSDSAYTDATAFKTAMSGVMLVYELATPTTESADPYQHLQQCDPNGTEEYVSTGIVPIGHNSFYPENLRAKVEQLPWNFSSLIAPTESAFVATRNYTTGALFIVQNVLYKATSNIANGGTITPNTNCAATTLAEIISALA